MSRLSCSVYLLELFLTVQNFINNLVTYFIIVGHIFKLCIKWNETHAHGARNERGQPTNAVRMISATTNWGLIKKNSFLLLFLHFKIRIASVLNNKIKLERIVHRTIWRSVRKSELTVCVTLYHSTHEFFCPFV